ncbi:MAG: hypothetical protein HC897_11410, partial [Thermoanaerobaculia bacterium]|nr:hypothetical protein [Thermoanaerobaculia bacterium]
MNQRTGSWGRRRERSRSSIFATGEPMLWLTGGALALCALMVAGLILLVLARGLGTFWPLALVQVETHDGRPYLGEITREDSYRPEQSLLDSLPAPAAQAALAGLELGEGQVRRRLFRTGNFRITQEHFQWVSDYEIARETQPEWAMVLEQLEWGRFYGFPSAFVLIEPLEGADDEARRASARSLVAQHPRDGVRLVVGSEDSPQLRPAEELETASNLVGVAVLADGSQAAWDAFRRYHGDVRDRWRERRRLEKVDTGEVNHRQEQAR